MPLAAPMPSPTIKDIYLCLDVGDARVGIAISRSGVIAEPLETLKRVGRKQILDAIDKLVAANAATVCVVGLPLLERGVEGEQAEKTRAFGRSLARRIPSLRIVFQDERFSTSTARDIVKSSGTVDHFAAAVILQDYLDKAALARETKGTQ